MWFVLSPYSPAWVPLSEAQCCPQQAGERKIMMMKVMCSYLRILLNTESRGQAQHRVKWAIWILNINHLNQVFFLLNKKVIPEVRYFLCSVSKHWMWTAANSTGFQHHQYDSSNPQTKILTWWFANQACAASLHRCMRKVHERYCTVLFQFGLFISTSVFCLEAFWVTQGRIFPREWLFSCCTSRNKSSWPCKSCCSRGGKRVH